MKPSTHAAYRTYLSRYVLPRTEGLALRDFSIGIVARILKDAAAMHRLNQHTITKVRSIVSGIFTFAMSEGHYPGKSAADNPASHARIPETASKPKPTACPETAEVKMMLAYLNELSLFEESGRGAYRVRWFASRRMSRDNLEGLESRGVELAHFKIALAFDREHPQDRTVHRARGGDAGTPRNPSGTLEGARLADCRPHSQPSGRYQGRQPGQHVQTFNPPDDSLVAPCASKRSRPSIKTTCSSATQKCPSNGPGSIL